MALRPLNGLFFQSLLDGLKQIAIQNRLVLSLVNLAAINDRPRRHKSGS